MAVCWFFFTWWTVVVPLLMVPLSLAAIALPVGKRRQPPPLQAQQHWNVVQSAPGGPPQPLPPSPSPGWYRDPWSAGSRWWDGRCWTGHTSP
jgi:hypothetical protein